MNKALVGLAAVLAVTAVANANLLTNGDFSTGAVGTSPPTGWSYGNAGWGTNPLTLEVKDPTSGVWTPGVSPNGGNTGGKSYGGDMGGNHWIYQVVTGLTVGQSYTLSGYIAGGVGGAQALPGSFSSWYQLGYVPGGYSAGTIDSGAGCVNVAAQTIGAGGGGFPWTFGTGSFTASQSTYTIYYKYGAVNTNWNYYGPYVDGVDLTPEPAAALLLLAGLPMLRRRRA